MTDPDPTIKLTPAMRLAKQLTIAQCVLLKNICNQTLDAKGSPVGFRYKSYKKLKNLGLVTYNGNFTYKITDDGCQVLDYLDFIGFFSHRENLDG